MSRKIVGVYCLIRFLLGLSISFFFGTYSLFLIRSGLDLWEVNLVNTFYMASCFILQVPTGAAADAFGRKLSFLLSCLFMSAGFVVYYFSHSFPLFLVAEFIGAIGNSLYSGAFKSWMIDEVQATGEMYDLTRAYRSSEICNSIGVIVGVVIGAYAGSRDIALPWLMAAVSYAATGLIGFFAVKETRMLSGRKSYRNLLQIAIDGYHFCLSNERVRFAMVASAVFSFACAAVNMYWQPRFASLGFRVESMGWTHAATMAMVIAGTALSEYVQRSSREKEQPLLSTLAVFGLGILLAATTENIWLCLPMYYVHQAGRGMFRPLLDDYFNEEIDPRIRATVQSYGSMIATAGNGLGLAITGGIAKHMGIQASWIFSALAVFSFLICYLTRKER